MIACFEAKCPGPGVNFSFRFSGIIHTAGGCFAPPFCQGENNLAKTANSDSRLCQENPGFFGPGRNCFDVHPKISFPSHPSSDCCGPAPLHFHRESFFSVEWRWGLKIFFSAHVLGRMVWNRSANGSGNPVTAAPWVIFLKQDSDPQKKGQSIV